MIISLEQERTDPGSTNASQIKEEPLAVASNRSVIVQGDAGFPKAVVAVGHPWEVRADVRTVLLIESVVQIEEVNASLGQPTAMVSPRIETEAEQLARDETICAIGAVGASKGESSTGTASF